MRRLYVLWLLLLSALVLAAPASADPGMGSEEAGDIPAGQVREFAEHYASAKCQKFTVDNGYAAVCAVEGVQCHAAGFTGHTTCVITTRYVVGNREYLGVREIKVWHSGVPTPELASEGEESLTEVQANSMTLDEARAFGNNYASDRCASAPVGPQSNPCSGSEIIGCYIVSNVTAHCTADLAYHSPIAGTSSHTVRLTFNVNKTGPGTAVFVPLTTGGFQPDASPDSNPC